ncbi:MAG: Divalent-cation tolerance protein CutA [Chloroflexi bacterium]|nr:Divalent-cation tolerance protein CutA [Chloroflexota bacterium]
MKYCIVITTCENRGKAKSLADAILENRLAACVQLSNISSLYHWKGKIAEDEEIKLLIKTREERYKELEAFISRTHDYDVPEIIKVPIAEGSQEYLGWISDVTM